MLREGRPGRKPKRLYARLVRSARDTETDYPTPGPVREFLEKLERAGRLVAHGRLTDPEGDLLLYRAADGGEARRALRGDPFAQIPGTAYDLLEWDPLTYGSGVNLEPPPARGAGRLTLLHRVGVAVRDQKKARQWYHDVLGLTARAEDPTTGYLELSLGAGTSALSLIAPRREWGEPHYSEGVARIGGRTGIAFQTDSVAALELRLKHAGANITRSPAPEPWGGSVVGFTDPDGNEFLAFEPAAGLLRTRPKALGGAATHGR